MTNNRLTMPILRNMPAILFVLVFVLFSLLDERFFSIDNFSNIVESSAFVGLLAVGMTAVLLTGGIDLSVGATMYITAAVVGTLLQQDVNYLLAIVAGIIAGTGWGFVNAFLIAKVGLVPFVATLVTLTAGRGIGLLLTESRQFILPPQMAYAATDVLGIPLPVVVFAIVVIVAVMFLRFTAMGRQIYAMGNDLEAAKKAGLNVVRLTGSVYVISGFCAALAGVIAISQQGTVSAGIGEGVEFRAIAAAVLGGTSLFGGVGAVFPGTVIGVLLVQMISTGLVYLQIDLYLQDMIAAAVIFFAVFIDAQRMRISLAWSAATSGSTRASRLPNRARPRRRAAAGAPRRSQGGGDPDESPGASRGGAGPPGDRPCADRPWFDHRHDGHAHRLPEPAPVTWACRPTTSRTSPTARWTRSIRARTCCSATTSTPVRSTSRAPGSSRPRSCRATASSTSTT